MPYRLLEWPKDAFENPFYSSNFVSACDPDFYKRLSIRVTEDARDDIEEFTEFLTKLDKIDD